MANVCVHCKSPIPAARLAALPSTETCVKCSREAPIRGAMVWAHKTAPELVMGSGVSEILRHQRRGFHAQLPFSSQGTPGKE